MKRLIVLIGSFSICLSALCQKYDYHWILGEPAYDGPGFYANMDVLFTQNSADTVVNDRGVELDRTQTTISDSAGNLLFFTNGMAIYSRDNGFMQNGDSINYGEYWELWKDMGTGQPGSLPVPQAIVALPTDSTNIWNIFHIYLNIDTSYLQEYGFRLYQTRIDMEGDSGLGTVAYKNKTVLQDTISCNITACRHANGRDWWILKNKHATNCLYEFLVQSDTIINYGMQCLGGEYNAADEDDEGQAVFSPDGSKFAWNGSNTGISLYDFDRCSGQLSNPVFLPKFTKWEAMGPDSIIYPDSGFLQIGLSFSPNSRFLYLTDTKYLFQFDTWAGDIMASSDTIGTWAPPPPQDTPFSQAAIIGPFFLMQLAPDGKIYISADNGVKFLHVINNPNGKGDSSNFVNYGFVLPRLNTFGIPNYPNYRLGVLPGPCDTISGLNEVQRAAKEKILKIYPNPAADYTIVDYGYTDWSKGEVELQICNAIGQAVYTQQLPMYSGFQKIDVSNFASGMYTVFIKRNNAVVASGKVVKE